jgi:small GTP-binding protein
LQDSQQQWVSKLLVVGEGGVGKTSLLRALLGEAFNSQESTTHGIEIRTLGMPHPTKADVTMQLNTWDFGGQEIYHATHQFFLTNRSLFLVGWNARHGFEQGKLYYWLDTIQALAPESPILLVATHIDSEMPTFPLPSYAASTPRLSVSAKSAVRQAKASIHSGKPLLTLLPSCP